MKTTTALGHISLSLHKNLAVMLHPSLFELSNFTLVELGSDVELGRGGIHADEMAHSPFPGTLVLLGVFQRCFPIRSEAGWIPVLLNNSRAGCG